MEGDQGVGFIEFLEAAQTDIEIAVGVLVGHVSEDKARQAAEIAGEGV